MATAVFYGPRQVIWGEGCLAQLPQWLRQHGVTHPLIVTDGGVVRAGIIGPVVDLLRAADLPPELFQDVDANPTTTNAERGAEAYRNSGCNGLVAVGGGSPIDAAKAIGVLVQHGGRVLDYEGIDRVPGPIPVLVAVPTTCGTGSEVTRWSVITNPETHYKSTVASQHLIPALALVDPVLLYSLPAHLVAYTGVDALVHALEAYTNQASQPLSDAMCMEAIRMAARWLRPAVAGNREALAQMSMASSIAGVANCNARAGLIHAMSHPLSGHAGVHHGLANAILTPYVMAFNRIGAQEKYVQIAIGMGEDPAGLPPEKGAELAVAAVTRLIRDVGVPATLRAVGVDPGLIEAMTDDTMKSGNVAINARRVSRAEVVNLYREAMG